ncbi:MAG: histidine phosphatase family protein [Rhizonema sp. PD38]|nr:histidine phosphatase family protein [Rhizonema sp. PD38]
MNLRLYLLRHGETTYSRTGGYCGDLDPELTPEGSAMAKAFADAYHSIPWTAVYTSPMKRTIATAKPLCDAIGMEMQVRPGLREIKYGEWEGKTLEFVQQHYADEYIHWLSEPAWNPPTHGETSVQVASRATLVIGEIVEKHLTGHVLVVSHKATLRIILCSLLGIDLGRYRDHINILVASVSIVKFATYGPLLEVLGDAAKGGLPLRARHHLPEHLLALPGS